MVNIILSNNAFDEEKFRSFAKKYSLNFPESYIEFLRRNNDSEMESNIIEGTEELGIYVRYFYGTTDNDYSDIEMVYKNYIMRMPSKCIPIADADFGNEICMSLKDENYGKIYFWDHESMDTDYDEKCNLTFEDMIPLADSFENLLDKIIPFDVEVLNEKEQSFFDKIKNIFKR